MKDNKALITLLSITIALFLLLALWTNNIARQNIGQDGFNVVLSPATSFIKKTGDNASKFFTHFRDTEKIITENAVIKEENEKLKRSQTELANYKKENDRLRDLLGLRDNYHNYRTLSAEITSNAASNWQSEFDINLGQKDGVTLNSVVTSPRGLVGEVVEIGSNWSRVRTILNPKTAISGIIVRNDEATVIEGRLDLMQRNLCELTYISKSASLIAGDVVQTSGRGGIYPPGITIGTVKEIIVDKNTGEQTAIINPAVNFQTLREVVIIIK